jgi:hypothetical protein
MTGLGCTFGPVQPMTQATMRRSLALLLLSVATVLLGAATASMASAATTIGMGDQALKLFSDPRFTTLTKVRTVRYIAPWDVQNDPAQRAFADNWIAAAKAKGYLIHVAFNYSAKKPEVVPSVAAYAAATKAFVARHKLDVETWGVFNEANRGVVKGRFATPGPVRAAQYFKVFRSKVCVGCRVVGLDVLDGNSIAPTIAYVAAFRKAAGSIQPKIWGFHNYSDVNRKSATRTGAFIKAVKGQGQVWVTETGGLFALGDTFFPDSIRQANATRQVFAIAKKYPIIRRVYLYNFYGPGDIGASATFDAGLIAGTTDVPRKAYDVFKAIAQ